MVRKYCLDERYILFCEREKMTKEEIMNISEAQFPRSQVSLLYAVSHEKCPVLQSDSALPDIIFLQNCGCNTLYVSDSRLFTIFKDYF